jgi:hypothetical protein
VQCNRSEKIEYGKKNTLSSAAVPPLLQMTPFRSGIIIVYTIDGGDPSWTRALSCDNNNNNNNMVAVRPQNTLYTIENVYYYMKYIIIGSCITICIINVYIYVPATGVCVQPAI